MGTVSRCKPFWIRQSRRVDALQGSEATGSTFAEPQAVSTRRVAGTGLDSVHGVGPDVRRTWPVMGTQASLVVRVPPGVSRAAFERSVDGAVAAARARLESIEAKLSSYRPNSELSKLADGRLSVDAVGADLRHCLAASEWLQGVSEGVFDPRHSGTLDLAGYVKGWAGDEAAAVLDAAELGDWALGIGGDWVTRVAKRKSAPWRIAIRNPFQVDGIAAISEIGTGALATSGTYERGEHLVASGQRSWASFSVVGPQLGFTDAFATIGFLMDRRGMDWVTSFDGYHCLGIETDGRMRVSSGFPLAAEHGRRAWPRVPGSPSL